jgi:hypothetical protein
LPGSFIIPSSRDISEGVWFDSIPTRNCFAGAGRQRGVADWLAQVETALKSSAKVNSNFTSYFLNGGVLNLKNLAEAAMCSL